MRRGFLRRYGEAEQREVLRAILAAVEEARPAVLGWEWVRERVRFQLDPDDNERLAQLEKGPAFGPAVDGWLGRFSPAAADPLPLARPPTDPRARQRLARFRGNPLGLPRLAAFPLGAASKGLLGALLLATVGLAGWGVREYLVAADGGCGGIGLSWSGPWPADGIVRIARQEGEGWRSVYQGAALPGSLRIPDACRGALRFELWRDGAVFTAFWWDDGVPAATLGIGLTAGEWRLPCEERPAGAGYAVRRCPAGADGTLEAPGWRRRLGEEAPAGRVASIGVGWKGAEEESPDIS